MLCGTFVAYACSVVKANTTPVLLGVVLGGTIQPIAVVPHEHLCVGVQHHALITGGEKKPYQ